MIKVALRLIDKEFSLPLTYPKAHGDLFLHCLKKYHPGAMLVLLAHTPVSRQDLYIEGAAAVYWNRQ